LIQEIAHQLKSTMRQLNFFIIALLLITFTPTTHAQPQRTKIAIVGLAHSHC
jgi:hypothetical protein